MLDSNRTVLKHFTSGNIEKADTRIMSFTDHQYELLSVALEKEEGNDPAKLQKAREDIGTFLFVNVEGVGERWVKDEVVLRSFGLSSDEIQKARGLPDGTVRIWSGEKHERVNGKWVYRGKAKAGESHKEEKEVDLHDEETIKKVSAHAGISPEEFKKMHSDTKKELHRNMKNDKEDSMWENKSKEKKEKEKMFSSVKESLEDEGIDLSGSNRAKLVELVEKHNDRAKVLEAARKEFGKKGDDEFEDVTPGHEHKKGDTVRVPHNLTSDPYDRRGQTGTVSFVNEDVAHVKFANGGGGIYNHNALQKEKKNPTTLKESSR